MVFNVIHGASEKDPGSLTMPFHFNSNIDLAGVRVGVRRPQGQQAQQNPDVNFTVFLEKLKSLGAVLAAGRRQAGRRAVCVPQGGR